MAFLALFSLAVGSFGIGMTEFVIMGLLPEIAAGTLPELWRLDSDQAIAQAGLLISLYALGVVVGAPTISGFAARFPRHIVMIVLAAALTIFNAAILIAPTFEWVAATRFLAGLPHGAYFGIGALVAAELLGPGKRAQGVAFVLMGLTVANVIGVPAGTFIGQTWGWHGAFVIVAVIFAIATVMILFFVPSIPGTPGRRFRDELRVFRIGQVWATLATGAIGFGGFFAVYSYVSPLVTDIAGSPAAAVPWVLVVMGIGMTIGNLIGGRLADRDVPRTLLGSFVALIAALALLALTSGWIVTLVIAVFLVGVTSSIAAPTIQTRLMDVAEDNQSIAAALNHSALNIGNSMGAFLGGAVIAAGWGFNAPPWVGAALAVLGLGAAILSLRADGSLRTTGSRNVRVSDGEYASENNTASSRTIG